MRKVIRTWGKGKKTMKEIDKLPITRDILNCNKCFLKGKRDTNSFKLYSKGRKRYFVCNRCKTIFEMEKK